ncbi:MAG: ATP-binding cassette domain-containing protein [Eubacterium sp.]
MIEFKNVSFSYKKKQVLKDFNLTVNNGEKICLYGESGVGKTTILRLILGLEGADKGSVICTDKSFSVVFQENRLIPFKTAEENITLFGKCDRLDYFLTCLGIDEARSKYPSQLSGGMARRVAIARALSVDADIYIFDEPFTGLDSDNTLRAVNLINEITKDKTVISVMHDTDAADLLNSKIIKINLLTE